jgi:hypothetical protein
VGARPHTLGPFVPHPPFLPDFDSAAEISARAARPGGNTCQAGATLTDT